MDVAWRSRLKLRAQVKLISMCTDNSGDGSKVVVHMMTKRLGRRKVGRSRIDEQGL